MHDKYVSANKESYFIFVGLFFVCIGASVTFDLASLTKLNATYYSFQFAMYKVTIKMYSLCLGISQKVLIGQDRYPAAITMLATTMLIMCVSETFRILNLNREYVARKDSSAQAGVVISDIDNFNSQAF